MSRPRFSAPSLVIAVALGLLGSAPTAAFDVPAIPFSPRHYLCATAIHAPVIDGRLDDPAWTGAAWSEPFVDIEGPARPRPELATRVKMLWDADHLYIGADLVEPHVWARLTERDAVIYHDDDFEVFIDPDGDNHLYYELEINALGTEWDLLLVRPYRDGGPAVNAWDIQGLRTAVHVDGTLGDPGDEDRGWSVEMAIPWDVLAQCAGRAAPPASGDVWRLNFSRVDWDVEVRDGGYVKTGAPEHNWVWSPQGLIAMHYPEMWGLVEFRAPGPAPAEPSPELATIAAAARLMDVYYAQRRWYEEHGGFADRLEDLGLDDAGLAATTTLVAGPRQFQATLSDRRGIFTIDHEGRLRRDLGKDRP